LSGLRVLVCGGRDLDRIAAWNWLERNAYDEIAHATGCYSGLSISAIIHGGARGADQGAADWGESQNVPVVAFVANWKKHGKSAGPIRNHRMLEEGKPDIVIALPGGRGTADMVRQAKGHGVPVIEVEPWPTP
jgi:hypothetical protein